MAERQRKAIQEVNIEMGDELSDAFYQASKQTFANRPTVFKPSSTYFGTRRFRIPGSPIGIGLNSDGIGTKVELSERLEDHRTMAYNLTAMACDDAVRDGGEPVGIQTILDVNQVVGDPDDPEQVAYMKVMMRQLIEGYVAAANDAGIVISGGELAELGDRVGGYEDPERPFNFHYNWGATAISYVHDEREIDGTGVKEGDALVAFKEQGFRSNGITDVRDALVRKFGEHWHKEKTTSSLGGRALGELVLAPSIIYSPLVTDLTGGYKLRRKPVTKITGVAHITGGGQPSKLGRMLQPSGLGAVIDNPHAVPHIMEYAQELLDIDDTKAYKKWNLGSGMIVATPDPETVIEVARYYGIDAKRVGEVVARRSIMIANKGVRSNDETAPQYLEFPTLSAA
jgi:phosphoribosylformylglycinamidine cyclo-ligase